MSLSKYYMSRCLELAKKGIPSTLPNPSVGAVLVYQGRIIGEGYTSPYGGNHGEVNCLNSVKEKDLIPSSTLYVSLEPCSHIGKTPPCADLILQHKIPKVVVGCLDTFSEVSGRGIERLRQHGVEVELNVLEKECRELNKRFFTFHEKKRPFILLKWAETADKFIAPSPSLHEKERWITGSEANQFTHSLRATERAILVGKNTVLTDNPSLTTRNYPGDNPIRIVIDRKLETWKSEEDFSIYQPNSMTWILNEERNFKENSVEGIQISFEKNVLNQLMDLLTKRIVQSLIVEGGRATLQQFLDQELWDEAYVLSADKTFGEGLKAPRIEKPVSDFFEVGKNKVSLYKNTTF